MIREFSAFDGLIILGALVGAAHHDGVAIPSDVSIFLNSLYDQNVDSKTAEQVAAINERMEQAMAEAFPGFTVEKFVDMLKARDAEEESS
jgi:hypothetical protein